MTKIIPGLAGYKIGKVALRKANRSVRFSKADADRLALERDAMDQRHHQLKHELADQGKQLLAGVTEHQYKQGIYDHAAVALQRERVQTAFAQMERELKDLKGRMELAHGEFAHARHVQTIVPLRVGLRDRQYELSRGNRRLRALLERRQRLERERDARLEAEGTFAMPIVVGMDEFGRADMDVRAYTNLVLDDDAKRHANYVLEEVEALEAQLEE
jgi:hypothetical protein